MCPSKMRMPLTAEGQGRFGAQFRQLEKNRPAQLFVGAGLSRAWLYARTAQAESTHCASVQSVYGIQKSPPCPHAAPHEFRQRTFASGSS